MDKIVSLCKRRGFVFPSSEIYGGLGSSYDYGHYGVLLKNNVKNAVVAGDAPGARRRRRARLGDHPAPARRGSASGHLAGFTDPLVDCRTCKLRFRADHLEQAACGRKPSKHPGETPECDLTEARDFNLMFETTVGPVKERARPSTCAPRPPRGSS